MRLIVCSTLCVFMCLATVVPAANFSFVARVNDNAISSFALKQRAQLMMKSGNVPNIPEARQAVASQALQTLINEELQRQHAEELDIKVADSDIKAAKAELERQNGLKAGGFNKFIRQQGVSESAVLEQIKAQITWQKVVSARIASRVQISDEEVNDARRQYKDIPAKQEVFLAEIVLKVTEGDDLEIIKEMALDIYKRIQKGESFNELAKQFSVSSTASEGGRVGWFKVDELRGAFKQKASKAKKGTTFPPEFNEAVGVFRILNLVDKRSIGKAVKRTDEDIRNILRRKKIEKEAQAYMKKLRQEAFIDIVRSDAN